MSFHLSSVITVDTGVDALSMEPGGVLLSCPQIYLSA